MTRNEKNTVQLWLAVGLVIFGAMMILAGFVVDPLGQIHPSVLTAFGECLTFAGSVIGIDYSYRKRAMSKEQQSDKDG